MNLEQGMALFALSVSAVLIAFFVVVLIFLVRGFLSFRGSSFTELVKFIKYELKEKIKEDAKEIIIENTLSREQQREILMDHCRKTIMYSENEVERNFNTLCLKTLENNSDICTMNELMTELDKMDKNLLINNLKGN